MRGHVDLGINASFWLGAALGAGASLLLLNTTLIPPTYSWRFAFGLGAAIGAAVLVLRRHVPESPRWLMVHGDAADAERIVADVERAIATDPASFRRPPGRSGIRCRTPVPFREIWHAMVHQHRRHSVLGFALMVTQAFFYNAVLFTYGLVLLRYYHVPAEHLGLYLVPLALGNFLGPVLMGRLFDTVGRRTDDRRHVHPVGGPAGRDQLVVSRGLLTTFTQALSWSLIFFVASSAASSAYLTVSEIFPLEIRAFAIALFYTCGTFVGGVLGPALFGYLVGTGDRALLARGYLAGATAMVMGGWWRRSSASTPRGNRWSRSPARLEAKPLAAKPSEASRPSARRDAERG